MKPHLQYAKYVVKHKWFVFVAGIKTGAPLWRLIIHDWSKMTRTEWGPYVRQFYAKHKRRPGEFDKAWLHHQHHNPHHWQHWVLKEDDGGIKALEMPDDLIREMVADWMGAGRAITGRWEVGEWWAKNDTKIILAPYTRSTVMALVRRVSW